MANHKSALKRIRSNEKRRVRNRYFLITARNAVKKLKETTSKKEADKLFPEVQGMVDKLVKKNIIHKNKAAHMKSQLSNHIAGLK